MKKALLLAVFLFAIGVGTVWGGSYFKGGNDLLDDCSGAAEISMCSGYVAGVADTLELLQNLEFIPRLSCTSKPGVTLDQLVDVVKKYLDEHPEARHNSAPSSVQHALAWAFPCEAEE